MKFCKIKQINMMVLLSESPPELSPIQLFGKVSPIDRHPKARHNFPLSRMSKEPKDLCETSKFSLLLQASFWLLTFCSHCCCPACQTDIQPDPFAAVSTDEMEKREVREMLVGKITWRRGVRELNADWSDVMRQVADK